MLIRKSDELGSLSKSEMTSLIIDIVGSKLFFEGVNKFILNKLEAKGIIICLLKMATRVRKRRLFKPVSR